MKAPLLARTSLPQFQSVLDMPIKLTNALKVEIWELFDFGHEVNIKELREAMNREQTFKRNR